MAQRDRNLDHGSWVMDKEAIVLAWEKADEVEKAQPHIANEIVSEVAAQRGVQS